MNICFCSSAMIAGGAEKVIASLANYFVKLGHKVTILMVAGTKKESFYTLSEDINLIALCEGKKKASRPIKRVILLRKALKSLNPDIAISFLYHASIYSYFALLGTRIPLLVSERNNPKKVPSNFLIRLLRNYVFKNASGIVFQLDEAKQYFNGKYRRGEVISNPVILNYHPVDSLISRKKKIIYVGSDKKEKKRKLLYDVFSIFYKNNPDYILEVYGIDSFDADKEHLKKNGIVDSVKYCGFVENWHALAFDATAFILTSDFEGMPNALLEAHTLGIPCISTDCPPGGPREILENGDGGILVEVGDAKKMAMELERLAADIKLQRKFSKKGMDNRTKYNVEAIGDKWLALIEEIIKNKISTKG